MVSVMDITQTNIITSREIAELTGKTHSNVMVDIRNLLKQIGNIGGYTFQLGEYSDKNKQKRPMYLLDKKASLLLASGYNPILRAKIIDRLEELENKNKKSLPEDYISALRALVASEEEKQRLLIENSELQPKGEFYDAVTGSDTVCDLGTAAKVLNMGVGRNTIFKILREEGILQKNNQPKQKMVDAGWFKIIKCAVKPLALAMGI